MSPEDIARAFVACPGWRWLAGMAALDGDRADDDGDPHLWVADLDDPGELPGVSDPATLAIIALVLLPLCWPGHSVQVEVFPDGAARVVVFKPEPPGRHASEVVFRISHEPVAVSLLRALEAAPAMCPICNGFGEDCSECGHSNEATP